MKKMPHTVKAAFVTGGSGFLGKHLIRRLVELGITCKALARSKASADIVQGLGAEPINGDVTDKEALSKGCQGCDTVYHCAGKVDLEGPWEEFVQITVKGTELCLQAAREAGVQRFVYVSSEQAILGGPVLVNADETWPYPENSDGPYAASKKFAELKVKEYNSEGFAAMTVRPRLIWGLEDSVVLPRFCEAVTSGKWKWIGGGTHLTSTVNVKNVVEGMLKVSENGRGGEVYFLTDGEAVEFKSFMTRLMKTRGVDASNCGSLPCWLASFVSFFGVIPGPVINLFGKECTVSNKKVREECGYENVISIEEGLKELEEESAAKNAQ